MNHLLTVFFVGQGVQIEKTLTFFFDTLDSAIRFAESKNLDFEVIEPKKEKLLKNLIQGILLNNG